MNPSSSSTPRITLDPRGEWMMATVDAETKGQSVEDFVRRSMHVSGRMLQKLTRSKGLRIGSKTAHLRRKVCVGDVVRIRVATAADRVPVPLHEGPISVLWSDPWWIALDKPVGISCHRTRPTDPMSILDHLTGKAHLVHRLDALTSGVLLIARNGYAHQRMDALLRTGGILKEYQARVDGMWDEELHGEDLIAPIARDREHKTRRVCAPRGDHAHTRVVRVVSTQDAFSDLLVSPITGRTHQLRVHLSGCGHPVRGDHLYGSRTRSKRLMLHARSLTFVHPITGDQVYISSACDLFSSVL